MDNITVDMNNLTETEREQLLTLVTKANKDKSKVYVPECGEQYWRILSSSGLSDYTWKDDCVDFDLLAIGNCFKSLEEAEFEVERLKVIKELKDYALEYNESEIDWKEKNKDKWYIYYNYYYSAIYPVFTDRMVLSTVYFTSQKIAESAIKVIGKDRLKKYYFGIEE